MPRGGEPPLSELLAFDDGALLAISGIGGVAAQAAARALIDAGVAALMTFGMAGGLDPALQAGSVVLPCELISADGTRFVVSRSWRERVAVAVSPLLAVSAGALLTSARAIDTPAEKSAAFRDTGAAAVDMESAAVAAIAAHHNLPFIAVRVVVDTAADTLPRAVVNASSAGQVQIGRLIAGLILAPGEIAALIRLAQRYRIAMRSLRTIGAHLAA
jgi:adenosylhomocysteine nucleosidase